MNRLVIYELRKLFDTRAAFVVMSVCVLLSVALASIGLVVRTSDGSLDLSQMGAAAVLPFAFIAPILGVMTSASDWSSGWIQQTLLIEHRRERIYAAKAAAAVVACTGTAACALVAAIGTGLLVGFARGQMVVPGPLGVMLWGVTALVLPGVLFGFGLGVLLLSTPLAIAVVLVVEIVLDVALSALPNGIGTYLESASISNWMTSGAEPLAAATSIGLWICVPWSVGLVRFMRREATA
jgi:ABC-type transport system involved in multi-copper enzyme maturation permease subunit